MLFYVFVNKGNFIIFEIEEFGKFLESYKLKN